MKAMHIDLLVGPAGSACAAAAGAVGTWFSMASQAALELFGVPLPVVLAALTGACGARVFLEPQGFGRAVAASVLWTAAGAFLAQLVLWAVGAWTEKTVPPGALAGIALVTALLGQRFAPIVWDRGGAAMQRYLDGLFNNKGGSA